MTRLLFNRALDAFHDNDIDRCLPGFEPEAELFELVLPRGRNRYGVTGDQLVETHCGVNGLGEAGPVFDNRVQQSAQLVGQPLVWSGADIHPSLRASTQSRLEGIGTDSYERVRLRDPAFARDVELKSIGKERLNDRLHRQH